MTKELETLLKRMKLQYDQGQEDTRPMTSLQLLERSNRRKQIVDQLTQNDMKVKEEYLP
jgi:hypothetical protein